MGDGDAAVSVQSSNVVRWEESMATFVLVHGAWHGAWCWRRVVRILTQAGHEVFTPALTGVGERSHLLKPDVNLDTHILDVANEMKWQELNNVVLVGHSYAGMVISGVAEKMEKSIGSFVMLDGFFPETGEALVICSLRRFATVFWQRSAMALWLCRHARRRCSTSTKKTARGSMRNAHLILSNAFCRN
jgi:pimeloyl-ACP methyl ester carboxylesterase